MFTLNNGETVGTFYGDDKYLLAKLLVEAMDVFGHPLSFEEVKQYPRMPKDPNAYAVHFGSLENACREAYSYVSARDKNRPESDTTQDGASARERKLKSAEFQLKRICADAEEPTLKAQRRKAEKRAELIEIALELCRRRGNDTSWITEDQLRYGPILTIREVRSAFGSNTNGIERLKRAVEKRLYEEELGDTVSVESSTGKSKEENSMEQKSENLEDHSTSNEPPAPTPQEEASRIKAEVVTCSRREEVLQLVKVFYQKNGELPTQSQCTKKEGLPSWSTICRYLGPKDQWESSILGQEPQPNHEDDMHDDTVEFEEKEEECSLSTQGECDDSYDDDDDSDDEECTDDEYLDDECSDDDEDDEDEEYDDESSAYDDECAEETFVPDTATPFHFEMDVANISIEITLSGDKDVAIRISN